MSPLPFGVLPPGFLCALAGTSSRRRVSIAFRRSAPWLRETVAHERWANIVSIAFRRSAPWLPDLVSVGRGNGMGVSIAFRRSAPWLHPNSPLAIWWLAAVSIAFRRSAPWLHVSCCTSKISCDSVSIAFRRSAPWLLMNPTQPGTAGERLHCLSAFCPLASGTRWIPTSHSYGSLHCLSAFCPLASRRRSSIQRFF